MIGGYILPPFLRRQCTHVLFALVTVESVAFEVNGLEEEAAAEQHPGDAEPLEVEDAKADPLVATFSIDTMQQVVEGGNFNRQILGIRLVQEGFATVDLHFQTKCKKNQYRVRPTVMPFTCRTADRSAPPKVWL